VDPVVPNLVDPDQDSDPDPYADPDPAFFVSDLHDGNNNKKSQNSRNPVFA
jgi:hypothetical protein